MTACTQDEVNRCVESAKCAQKIWARVPLWKRAEALHRCAAIMKEQKAPIADCLVKEVAKALKDAVVEVSLLRISKLYTQSELASLKSFVKSC